jgi:hypothetical protein
MPKTKFQSLMEAIRENPPTERASILNGYFPYETIKFSGRLKILDSDRQVAVFARRQRIRFLEDGVSVFFDRVWGEGVLFGAYFAPGLQILEPIRTPNGYIVPLQLPRRFRAGETFDIATRRRIIAAFYDPEGYWETATSVPANLVQISVVTPNGIGTDRQFVQAPPRGDIDATIGVNSMKLRVERPALNTSYRLGWLWK